MEQTISQVVENYSAARRAYITLEKALTPYEGKNVKRLSEATNRQIQDAMASALEGVDYSIAGLVVLPDVFGSDGKTIDLAAVRAHTAKLEAAIHALDLYETREEDILKLKAEIARLVEAKYALIRACGDALPAEYKR